MTDHKPMNTIIHDALRRDLDRLDDGFRTYADGPPGRAEQLMAAWTHFSYQLHAHHDDEETGFWPAFRQLGVDDVLMEDLAGEHDAMVRALAAVDRGAADFGRGPTGAHAARVRTAIVELRRVLEDHLAHEERDLNPFSTANGRTKQVKAAAAAAQKRHDEGAPAFFAWLADGCGEEDLRALRHEVPALVLWAMVRLGRRRYQRSIAAAWEEPIRSEMATVSA